MERPIPEETRKRVRSTVDALKGQIEAVLTRTPFKSGYGIQVRDVMGKFRPFTQKQLEPFFYVLQEPPYRMFDIITVAKQATPHANVPLRRWKPPIERVSLVPGEEFARADIYSKREVEEKMRHMARPVLRSSATYSKSYRGSKGSLLPTPIGGKWSRALLVQPGEVTSALTKAETQVNVVADRWDQRRYAMEERLGRTFRPDEILGYPRRVAERGRAKFGGMLRQPSDDVRRTAYKLGFVLERV